MYCPVASETVVGADWGTLAVSVSGGTVSPTYQYQWVKMPSGVNISNSFGGNTNSIRINSGGDYMVIVSDANALVSTGNVSASTASCSVSQLFSVTGPSEPLSAEIVLGSNDKVTGGNVEILFDTSSTTISCKGDSNGSFTFVIKGGSPPYEYKNGGGGWTSASGATVQLTGLSADTYNIRVRDAGKCVSGGEEGVSLSVTESGTTTDNVAVLISEPPEELSASLSGAQQEIDCSTGIDGKIEISVTGGQAPYQLIWTGPAGSNYKALTSIDNNGDSSCNYCYGKKDPKSSDNPEKAIISLKNERETTYAAYISVQNELVAAYNILRNRRALELGPSKGFRGMDFVQMQMNYKDARFNGDKEKLKSLIDQIKLEFPQKLSEVQ